MRSEKFKNHRVNKSLQNMNSQRPDIITNGSPNENMSNSNIWSDAQDHKRNDTDIDMMEHSSSNLKLIENRKNKKK